MVIHPMKIVCWISIVVIHIFIILMPKDAKLIMIVQLIYGTASLGHIGVKRMKKLHKDGFSESLVMNHLMLVNRAYWAR